MKKKIIDIPEVNLSDVKEFWILGSQYKDGILGEYNLKMNVKAAVSGEGGGGDDAMPVVDLRSYTIPESGTPTTIDIDIPLADKIRVISSDGESVYTRVEIPAEEFMEICYGLSIEGGVYQLYKIKDNAENLPENILGKWVWEVHSLTPFEPAA